MQDSLLQKIGNGEASAVSDCVDRYGGLIWSLAGRFIASRSDAEDAVQEIFIELWKCASRFDPAKSSEISFVAMIARRRLIDVCRRRKITLQSIESDELVGNSQSAEVQIENNQEVQIALAALNQLPDEQSKAIKLSVYNGLSHSQIAKTMGLPLGTIKTHIRRGLIKVREQLQGSAISETGGLA